MTEVTGRVLEPPLLKLGDGRHVRPRWDDRQWNLVKSHVFDGTHIENWGLITFSCSNGNDTRHISTVENFYQLLVRKCLDMGVYMNEKPLVCEYESMEKFSDCFQLREIFHNIHSQTKGELQVLICVIENGLRVGYNYLKLICDIEVGLVTQCCLFQHVSRCSYPDEKKASQYLASLVMKINAKVGGSNVALHENPLCKSPGSGHSDPVMIIGAHVTQGPHKDLPSIAAVVGSINWPDCNRYLAKIRFQMRLHQAGRIENVGEMCEELLKDCLRINKQLPGKILFFRSGTSEGCRTLFDFELRNLKEAINFRASISFILACRSKQTRLFPFEEQPRTRSGNVIPGTVVDTDIVHPSEFDFYLCSHYTHKGTAIPTRYHVIWDENAFNSDELQKLVNNLCYTSARCTKPVSLVAPIYYARLAARRGRQYAEAQSFELSSPPFELPEAIKDTLFFC
jgi:eukaryotic translation initiation factor 2C